MKQELEQKTRRSILRGRNSGQAVVEYILIVSIAVALVFIMKGAFKGMSNFIDNYLGLYTECLMAHGELPSLGVSDSASFSDGSGLKEHLNSDYKCESGFKSFTLVEGRPPIATSSAGSGSRASSGGSKNNQETSAGGSSSSSSEKSKRDNAVSGGGSSSNPYESGQVRRGRSSADGFASNGGNKSRLIEEGEGDELDGSGRRRKPRESRIIYRDRQRYRAVLGQEAEQLLNQSSRSTFKRKPTSRTIAKADGGNAPGPRSGLMKPPPEKKILSADTPDEGWGFGKLIKFILIIGIIVALVILFGGQLLNYSNSDS